MPAKLGEVAVALRATDGFRKNLSFSTGRTFPKHVAKNDVQCRPDRRESACFHLPIPRTGTTLNSPPSMQISSLLKPEQIKLELAQQKRCNAINEVAQLLQGNPSVTNFPGFYEELLARERIESTCLGNEIAFPHARTDYLKGMVLAVGRSPQGVWFENCGETVKLIFVIGTPKRMVTDYLSVVGGLARLLKDAGTRQKLLAATDTDEFIAALTQAELAR